MERDVISASHRVPVSLGLLTADASGGSQSSLVGENSTASDRQGVTTGMRRNNLNRNIFISAVCCLRQLEVQCIKHHKINYD